MISSEAAYSGYVHKPPKTNWSSTEAVKNRLEKVCFDSKTPIRAGGIPVISDGKSGYIDTSDNHVATFGVSGFKKSIVIFMELICTLALAGENMFISDPKGELYTRTALFLKSRGYRIRVLNFRDYNGEGYNPLHYPAKLYKNGNRDKALTVTSDVIGALASKQEESKNVDPFWPSTAKSYNNGVIPLMYDSYADLSTINFMSLADYYTDTTADELKLFFNEYPITNAAITNLRTVLSEPERTRMSTLATASSFIQPFIQNDKLARMISNSTFELEELAGEKTAIFVITDDTTTICNPIIGVLISQLQTILVDMAFHFPSGKLPHRVNFVLDEFCSFPIPNMSEALSTHRSRNIRYFLCIQSLDLLEKRYHNYLSLLANCATTLFLGSTETKLLEDISKRCGTTSITPTGKEEPLISVSELMTLHKSWDSKELLYLNLADSIRYCTTLPAIEAYENFCKFGPATFPNIKHPSVNVYTFKKYHFDLSNGDVSYPFSSTTTRKRSGKQ